MKNFRFIFYATAVLVALSANVSADYVFTTQTAALTIGEDGTAKRLLDERGRDLLSDATTPFAVVGKAGRNLPASHVIREGTLLHVSFGEGVQADIRLTSRAHYLLFELEGLTGQEIDSIRLIQLHLKPMPHVGNWSGIQWSPECAIAMFGLSDRVNTTTVEGRLLQAIVYREFGMVGQKAAVVSVPLSQFPDVAQEVERDWGLPSPKLNGVWAKASPDVRTSYLFTDVSQENVEEAIRYAKLGGFAYIMIRDNAWSSSLGSYPVNLKNFPQGEASLKATIGRCHRAGLKVGMHMATSFVSKHDPLVRPKPDRRLLKDDETPLASDVRPDALEIKASTSLATFPNAAAEYGSAKAGLDIQIDDEIIHYGAAEKATNSFVKCLRGYAGTKAAQHKAGAAIFHLAERYGCYLVDLKTSLKNEVSKRIAGIINRCGFDMIFFDGGECNLANGPFWYWVSQQQSDICQRVTRPILAEGSGNTSWTWHWFARGCSDDYAAVAPKQWLDYHKIPWAQSHLNNMMPAELGWWGLLIDQPDHPATKPDDVEAYATRMLGYELPVSVETKIDILKTNGRAEEMLQLLGQYEQVRLKGATTMSLRKKLCSGQWHKIDNQEGTCFQPINYQPLRIEMPGTVQVRNDFAAQPLRFRLQCVPTLASVGAEGNITLLNASPSQRIQVPSAAAEMPGALALRVDFERGRGTQGTALDLSQHRALAVTIRVNGSDRASVFGVLNIQLESKGRRFREYYVDLDFIGERTVIIPEPTSERMLAEFPPKPRNYALKMATYDFDYGKVAALNLRWMRAPGPLSFECYISRVDALAEIPTVVRNPIIAIGDSALTLPIELHNGDYAELWDKETLGIFDRNGSRRHSVKTNGLAPTLEPGLNQLSIRGDRPAAVVLTSITTGDEAGE